MHVFYVCDKKEKKMNELCHLFYMWVNIYSVGVEYVSSN